MSKCLELRMTLLRFKTMHRAYSLAANIQAHLYYFEAKLISNSRYICIPSLVGFANQPTSQTDE